MCSLPRRIQSLPAQRTLYSYLPPTERRTAASGAPPAVYVQYARFISPESPRRCVSESVAWDRAHNRGLSALCPADHFDDGGSGRDGSRLAAPGQISNGTCKKSALPLTSDPTTSPLSAWAERRASDFTEAKFPTLIPRCLISVETEHSFRCRTEVGARGVVEAVSFSVDRPLVAYHPLSNGRRLTGLASE